MQLAELWRPIILDEIVPPRAPWSHRVRKGQTLRIIDLEGNQAVDFLMYAADDDTERYSAQDTIAAQRNIYLRDGLDAVFERRQSHGADRRHRCRLPRHHRRRLQLREQYAALRLSIPSRSMPASRIFCAPMLRYGRGKRDMVSNINWFMNVPVEADGTLGIVDGISAPGLHVDLLAQMDLTAVVSNCPQINNPCNGFNPTPCAW